MGNTRGKNHSRYWALLAAAVFAVLLQAPAWAASYSLPNGPLPSGCSVSGSTVTCGSVTLSGSDTVAVTSAITWIINGNLTKTGGGGAAINIGGNVNNLSIVVSGSVSSLGNNSVINGSLTANSIALNQSSTVTGNVTSNTTINANGNNIQFGGNVTANGNITFAQNVSVAGSVTSNNGNISTASGTFGGNIQASSGTVNTNDQPVAVTGSVLASGNINLGNNSTVGINVTSSGGTVRTGNAVHVFGNVSAYGLVTLGNLSDIDGSVTSTNGGVTTESSGVQIGGGVSAANNISLGYQAAVVGPVVSSAGNITVGNEVLVNGNLSAAGNIIIRFEADIYGNTTSGGTTTTENNVQIYGSIESAGDVNLNYQTQVHGNINSNGTVNNGGTVGGYVNAPVVGGGGTYNGEVCDQNTNVGPCSGALHFEIEHDLNNGLCVAFTEITVRIRDSNNQVVTNFIGVFTITNTLNLGNYSAPTGNGTLNNLTTNDGTATYAFVAADQGEVVLRFSTAASGVYVFNVTSNTILTAGYTSSLTISACSFRIAHDGVANVCSQEQIAISVVNASGAPVNYTGSINLNTGGSGGNWSKTLVATDANGTLTDASPDDGIAQYLFSTADEGTITLNFQSNTAGSVNFNIVATGVSQPVAPYDNNLVVSTCSFRITSDEAMDVCSIQPITITLVDGLGATVTNYTGTINLSTTTGFGSWRVGDGVGTLLDPVAEDGNASYQFAVADAGSVTLDFTHLSSTGTVNINVTDGLTQDPRNASNPYDHNIAVSACSFEISHSEQMTACTLQAVTVTVRNSLGNIAVGYEGSIVLSTDTLNGNWSLLDGDGSLTETNGDDDGVAEYQFVASDNGVVSFNFADPHHEVVDINIDGGPIVVDPLYDSPMTVGSCLPVVLSSSCTNTTSTSLAVTAQSSIAAHRGRMVLMQISGSGTSYVNNSPTFAGTSMTLIHRVSNPAANGLTVELWGILDANLPVAAGSYAGSYSGGSAATAMCVMEIDQVSQSFPAVASVPATGPLNANVANTYQVATIVTTLTNNSLVVAATGVSAYASVPWQVPMPAALTHQFDHNVAIPGSPPYNVRLGVSAGRIAAPSVVETLDGLSLGGSSTLGRNSSQIVAAFGPLVSGTPEAALYDPVTLYRTLSGNISYRAIGNTLRSTYNGDAPVPLGCNFGDFASGTAASLSLPAGSSVRAAYLYWGGSGDVNANQHDPDVSFGPSGAEIPITAESVFNIQNTGDNAISDYFAAYRDVTDLVSGSGSYTLRDLTVQRGADWWGVDQGQQGCAGGWAMVVVYDNPNERLRVLNLFHGFQPFRNSAFTLVPRNFRMATHDVVNNLPNGQVTHITLEGDETLNSVNIEGLGIQTAPNSASFTPITSSLNPAGAEFNSTITRPIYQLDGATGYYEFNATGGPNADGYQIDFPGPHVNVGSRAGVPAQDIRIGNSWGMDIDTHYLQGAQPGEILYPFGHSGSEAEQITTRYSSAEDLVMLMSEVISVTNFPLADIEVFKSAADPFKINSAGIYQINVVNNGDGGISGGFATGEVVVADTLPAGMTFANAGDVSGAGWNCANITLNPAAFTCVYDIASSWVGGVTPYQLRGGENLPPINVTVQIGNSSYFPFRNNSVKNTARIMHTGGNCAATAAGLIPDPASCDRSPQFDNLADLENGAVDINTLVDKIASNNNVHSVTSVVKGIEVDLAINKFANDILESGSQSSYTLRVTNSGPDATTSVITVTDIEPNGLNFVSGVGVGWNCSVGANLSCTYAGSLGVGVSTDITLTVDVTGGDGYFVTNTAVVAAGPFNFDIDSSNNVDTDISQIVGAPVAAQEKFLMSVRSLNELGSAHGLTTIGGLANFEDDDYIIYDPVTDTATMFYDNSYGFDGTGFDVRDADAVHLMSNGHIVMSAAEAGSSVGTNGVAFEPGDLVIYDPILGSARMLFDGSAIFGGVNPEQVNITSVYLDGDCRPSAAYGCIIYFSATPAAGGSTIDGVSFSSADIVQYNPDTGDASLFFEGADYFDAAANVTINGFYLRVDPSNPDAVIDSLVIAARDANDDAITIAAGVGWDPDTGSLFTQDDVIQINRDAQESSNRFLGDIEPGVFESTGAESALLIDALHVIEDGYIGHFRLTQVGGDASVCSAAGIQIRITKHKGLSHVTDDDYFGTIRLSTNTGIGDWSNVSGVGTLNNGAGNDGYAEYTFVESDGGSVVLALNQSTAGSVNVDVSNGIAREGHPPGSGPEAPVFSYDSGVPLEYLDQFGSSSFGNQDGANAWASNWLEVDNTPGALAGDVMIAAGMARFTRTGSTAQPSLTRSIDLTGATVVSDLLLSFDFSYAALGAFDEFYVQARLQSTGSWINVKRYKRGVELPNNASGSGSDILNLTTLLGDPSGHTPEIRFVITQGYALSGQTFAIDNVRVTAATEDCDVSPLGVHHYEVNTPSTAVACVGAAVTITAHGATHSPIDAGVLPIHLSTSTGRGSWSRVLAGSGVLQQTGTTTDGSATYLFPGGENSVTLHFNYTGPLTDPEVVNINVSDGTHTELSPAEDPSISVSRVGLRLLNVDNDDAVTPIPTQIAVKPSNINPQASVLIIQAVSSADNDPEICLPLFDVGQELQFEFAAECVDSATCVAGEVFEVNGTAVALLDDDEAAPIPNAHTAVAIELQDYNGEPGAAIVINYSDVGRMRLHTRLNIPLSDGLPPLLAEKSGDTLDHASNLFVVRPFGFDVDFSDGRQISGASHASYATDDNGSLWKIAGESFDTTVTAVGWQATDDVNQDGVPDAGALLWDNHATPNFDQDSEQGSYSVKLTVTDNKVIAATGGGTLGLLSDDNFDNFVTGANTHSISYNEVGIIDLQAQIVDINGNETIYLGTETVRGRVLNLGRFYPNLFTVTNMLLDGRSDMVCSPESPFTYMGESFRVALQLTAKGLSDSGNYTTINYRGAYAKLDSYTELNFRTIEDRDNNTADVDHSARLDNQSLPASFAASWSNGELLLDGDLVFQRNSPAAPDGPFPAMQIAFLPTDNDGVTIDPERDGLTDTGVLNVDHDDGLSEPGTAMYQLIEEHEFRYGRLIINNAYGPETEDLALSFVVEYFDGSRFLRNTLDNCSTINVEDLSFVSGSYTGSLDAGETDLRTPDTVTFLEGATQGLENVLAAIEPRDAPLETSAPGEGNSGTVNVTLDLGGAGLEYLGFEWDGAGDDYDDDPSAVIEFGQYRMHDRVINWQEVYNRAIP